MRYRRTAIPALLVLCLLLSAAAGCAKRQGATPAPTGTPPGDYLNIDPERRPVSQKITLFYLHKPSGLLVPVTRTEYKGDTPMVKFIMTELLKGPGPGNESLAALIPSVTNIIDVTMSGTTALVYFDSGITGELPLQPIYGDAAANQDPAVLTQRTRELLLYSIVNTLTGLPGVANVKILIENHFATYDEMGLLSLAEAYGADPNTSMPSFARSADHILQPDDVILLLMNQWSTENPAWAKIYPFLYSNIADGSKLPGVEEMKEQWAGTIRTITVKPESVATQEMRGDGTALVAVSYDIERASGQTQTVHLEYLHMIYQNGVWRLELPPHWLDEDYAY